MGLTARSKDATVAPSPATVTKSRGSVAVANERNPSTYGGREAACPISTG